MRVRFHYKNGPVSEVDPAQGAVSFPWLHHMGQRIADESIERGTQAVEADQLALHGDPARQTLM